MSPLARYASLLRPHVGIIAVAAVLSAVATAIQGLSISLFADLASVIGRHSAQSLFPTTARLLNLEPVFDGIPVTLESPRQALEVLALAMLAILGLVAVKGVVSYGRTYLVHRVTWAVMTRTRNAIYEKILSLPLSVISQQRSGDVLSRSVDDVTIVTRGVSAISALLQASVAIVVYLSIMFIRSWVLTLALVVFLPCVALVLAVIGSRIRRASYRKQRELGVVASRFQEGIGGLKVLKSFGAERDDQTRLEKETRAMYSTAMRRARAQSVQSPLTEVVVAVAMLAVFGLGCSLILRDSLNFSDLLAHMGMSALLLGPLRTIGQFHATVQEGLASTERIGALLVLPSEDMSSGAQLDRVRGEIEFRAVTFEYADGDGHALEDVSFHVSPGETVALVGRSGAGKTTLIHLIPRFYEPSVGQILLDGVPTSQVSLGSLRSHMAFVPQDTLLFAGPIVDNIRLARPSATDAELEEAARRAYAHDFIMELPDGYGTAVGERGVRLSGGQQQRVAIARAFLKDPRVFLFDEATAALDSESEGVIRESFEELLRDRTAFVIAHRLATILHADLILVLDEGRLVESGRHDDLLALDGTYARLYRTQFAHDLD